MSVIWFGIIYILLALVAIAFRVCFAFAINYDCRARNLKTTSLFTVLAVFFPIIVGIVYACVRSDAEPNTKYCASCNTLVDGATKMCPNCKGMAFKRAAHPDTAKFLKRGKAFFIAAVLLFVFGCGATVAEAVIAVKASTDIIREYDNGAFDKFFSQFADELEQAEEETTEEETTAASDEDSEKTTDIDTIIGNLRYYDRDGKAYKDATEVPYYSKDGKTYFYRKEADLTQYFVEKDSDKQLDLKRCFVDGEGYFIYDEKGEITLSDDIVSATDKEGNKYIPASLAIWNEKGELITMF